jgi:hypothetical protein
MSVTRQSMTVLDRHFRMTVTKCRKLLDGAVDPYRPERHYMRGPGPKWRAKYQMPGATFLDRS